MSKFAKGKSWIENRLAADLELDGKHYTVNLLARKGTGVQGYRVSVVFLPHEGGADVEAQLPNAASTADASDPPGSDEYVVGSTYGTSLALPSGREAQSATPVVPEPSAIQPRASIAARSSSDFT